MNRLLTAECVVAPGGLRVRDTDSGVTVQPGCSCGLENWRDWQVLQDYLAGFLKSVAEWASCGFAPVVGVLVASLDEGFAVSAPLDESP
ncbi:hypothetical protein [Streptomyces sp. NPDC051214]|uniref:hypothetical protein n=1 Tax=Streptomyces sp. NPDC051214 TaxID=3155282 RepID=UPI003449C327